MVRFHRGSPLLPNNSPLLASGSRLPRPFDSQSDSQSHLPCAEPLRLYLRQFAADRRAKNPQLYAFDKTNQRVHRPSVRNVCSELHFYEKGDQGLEKWLTSFEDQFTAPFRHLLTADSVAELSVEQRGAIAVFLAVQFVRTREQREAMKSLSLVMSKKIVEWGADPGEWANVSEEALRAQHRSMLLGLATNAAETMVEMKWVLMLNRTPMPTWTSDNPIALYNPVDAGPRGNLGLRCEGIQLNFPLSPTRTLTLCDPKTYGALPDVLESTDINNIVFLNNLQVISSTRFVFANGPNFDLAREILADHLHYGDPNRPRAQAH